LADTNGAHLRVASRKQQDQKQKQEENQPALKSLTDAILDAIDDSVTCVALPQVVWTDGAWIDLARIKRSMPEHAVLIVDATQSLGMTPDCNVREIECDVLCASVHKWLLGPYGMSFFYAHKKFVDLFEPMDQHEHNREGMWNDACLPFSVQRPGYETKFKQGMRKFDAGGKPNPILMPMLRHSLGQILAWGPIQIEEYLRPLMHVLVAAVHALGIHTPDEYKSHLIGLRHPSFNEELVHTHLKIKRIYVSWRFTCIRVGLHVFNTLDDIEALTAALEEWIKGREEGRTPNYTKL